MLKLCDDSRKPQRKSSMPTPLHDGKGEKRQEKREKTRLQQSYIFGASAHLAAKQTAMGEENMVGENDEKDKDRERLSGIPAAVQNGTNFELCWSRTRSLIRIA